MLMITRQLQIDFHLFNLGVAKAREEYEAYPIAACNYEGCFELMEFGEHICAEHFRLLTEAKARMRRRRAS